MKISTKVANKLKEKHGVSTDEIMQCFLNRDGNFLEDTRTNNMTNPPTMWFLAETDRGKLLKVVFIGHPDNTKTIKTAYPPDNIEIEIYDKVGRKK